MIDDNRAIQSQSVTFTNFLAALFLVCTATVTFALNAPVRQDRSTFRLLTFCTSADANQINWCDGYLMGLADLLLAMGNSGIAGGICNAEYEPAILRKQFQLWAKRHLEHSAEDMAISVQAAFRELWPCG